MRSASSTGSSALDGICPFMTGEVNNALPAMLSLSLSCDLATRVICNQRESSYRLLISIWCAIMSEFSIKDYGSRWQALVPASHRSGT